MDIGVIQSACCHSLRVKKDRSTSFVCMLLEVALRAENHHFVSKLSLKTRLAQSTLSRKPASAHKRQLHRQYGLTLSARTKGLKHNRVGVHVIKIVAQQDLAPMSVEHAVGESVVVPGLRLTDHFFKVCYPYSKICASVYS